MKMKLSRCKLTRKQQVELLKFFIGEVTARKAAELVGINRNTCTLYYRKVREVIAYHIEQDAREYFDGEIELDESYFGGVRKGKRGRGAAGKVVVFGILKRGGKVFTKIVVDTKTATLMPIIRQKVMPDSIVYTDTYRSYNALDVSEFTHHRINHSTHFAEDAKHHINGIENFWNQAKRVLRKYNGIPKDSFKLFLKECEFRFNYGTAKQQLQMLKKWCIKT
jgi:transposase